jgi:hypothetical protein
MWVDLERRSAARMRVFAAVTACIGLSCAAPAALASVTASDLPSGKLGYGVSDNTPQLNFVNGDTLGSVSLGGATAGGAFFPEDVYVSGSIGAGTAETNLSASSALDVNFYINGPFGAKVPVTFMGIATGWATGEGIVAGDVSVGAYHSSNTVEVYQYLACTNHPESSPCGGSFDKTVTVGAGIVYTAYLETGGGFVNAPTATTSGPGAFSASVDPAHLISIDPTFLANHPGYSLVVNTGAPEPGAWSMMLLGAAGLGAALRRRRGELLAA